MKLSFAHLGNMYIPLGELLRSLGLEVLVPPPTTRRTLERGALHAPEFACLPLKVTVGNFLEAIELGADAFMMAGGIGPCRFGYYCELQREILRDLGHSVKLIALEPPRAYPREFFRDLRTLAGRSGLVRIVSAVKRAWLKACSLDRLEQAALVTRAREATRGSVTRALAGALARLDAADSEREVREATAEGLHAIQRCARPWSPGESRSLRVGVVGEVYVVLEPFVNLGVAEKLGELGAEVVRPITFSGWVRENVYLDILHPSGKPDRTRFASPYLNHAVGGHGLESIACSVEMARDGVDGVVHLAPFTCMPEVVAQSILPSVAEHEGMPIMSCVFDEHTGDAGLMTRLEAFVDLLAVRCESRAAGGEAACAGTSE
ncbi:MAG: CoA protein activase [Firmicutes bacterium]|jgi:predicted nucleotide-binding protein (sugar kinase/HSP70/actin superfamily)|nr:CoA protein activase [Bacillota bacterium]